VLEKYWLFNSITVDFHRKLGGVLMIRKQSRLLVIAVIVQAALLVCDTDALKCDCRRELGVFLSNIVVTFAESVLDHTGHAWILVNVTQLWCCLKTSLQRFSLLLFSFLGCEFLLVFLLLSSHLFESCLLFFYFSLKLCVYGLTAVFIRCGTTATASCSTCS